MNKMATVVGFFENSKAAKIQFDGEEKPAEKEYPYLSSYSPKLDDKVFCMEFGDSYIIMGEVNFQKEPFSLGNTFTENLKPIKDDLKATKGDLTTAKAKHDTDIKDLTKKLTDNANDIKKVNKKVDDVLKRDTFDTLRVTKYVGFFGASAASKRNVSTASNTSTSSAVGSKLNELINALKGYGLV